MMINFEMNVTRRGKSIYHRCVGIEEGILRGTELDTVAEIFKVFSSDIKEDFAKGRFPAVKPFLEGGPIQSEDFVEKKCILKQGVKDNIINFFDLDMMPRYNSSIRMELMHKLLKKLGLE